MTDQLASTLAALKRHLRLIIILPLLALAVSVVVSLKAQKQYTATATVLISPNNPVDQLLNPASNVTPADPERDLNTAVSQITQAPVLAQVRRAAHLNESDQDLLTHVTTTVEGTTDLVDVAVTDTDATRAAVIANAFAAQYVDYRLQSARAAIGSAIALVKAQLASAGDSKAVRSQLKSRLQQLQVYSSVQTSDAQLSQPATVPTSPSSPKPLKNAAIAFVVGLILALVVAIALDSLDRRVRDEEEGERASGLDLLARIPGYPLGKRQRNVIRKHAALAIDSEQAEAYRSLAVTVTAMIRADPRAQIVMVTSPGPRDGKTTISLGLSAALADLGQRVVAVECDLRRPRFGELLELEGSEGVSTILAGSSDSSSARVELDAHSLRPTPGGPGEPIGETERAQPAPGTTSTVVRSAESVLTVIPAGPRLAQPQPLLASQAMAELLVHLRSTADVVVIDTPPIGVVSDAVLLAPMVDCALLVGQIGRTKRTGLARAKAIIDRRNITALGLVLVGGPRGALKYYG